MCDNYEDLNSDVLDVKIVNNHIGYYIGEKDSVYKTILFVFSKEEGLIKDIVLDDTILIPNESCTYAIVDNQIKKFSIDYSTGNYSVLDLDIPITVPYIGSGNVIPRWVGDEYLTLNIITNIESSNNMRELYKVNFDTGILELVNTSTVYYPGGIGRTTTNNALLLQDSVYVRSQNVSDELIKLTKDNKDYSYQFDTTATPNDILRNISAYSNGERIIGTIMNNGILNYTPSIEQQIIPVGYTSGGTIAAVDNTIDSNITAENIKKDVTILGVTGVLESGDNINDYINSQIDTEISYSTTQSGISTTIKKLPIIDLQNKTSVSYMFYNLVNLESIEGIINSAESMTFNYFFYGCESLTSIPDFDTSSCNSTQSMFYNCSSLTTIPNLDFSGTNTLQNTFRNCTNLTIIPDLNIPELQFMANAFSGCISLTVAPTINATAGITDMKSTFSGCTSLTTIPIYNLGREGYSSSVSSMISNCPNLTNDSLHNVLIMLSEGNIITGTKTLAYVGFSETQANVATTFEEWTTMQNNGWTTGY